MLIQTDILQTVESIVRNNNPKKTGIYFPKDIEILYPVCKDDVVAFVGCQDNVWIIYFNINHIAKYYKRILSEVIPHELAHIADHYMFNNLSHNWSWRDICIKLGGNGKEFFEI